MPLVKSFRNSFPEGTFGVVEAMSAPIVEWLVEGRVDIGLVYNPVPLPTVEIRPLQEQELFLISYEGAGKKRQSKSVQLRELPRYPLIIPSRSNANRMLIDAQLAHLGLKPRIEFEIDGIASILDLVHEGYGHVLADSREVFGGPLTQITLLASKQTKEKNPILFKAVANALEESIRVAGADKRAAAILWKKAQNAPESVDDLVALLDDPGFEFTSEPHRIAYFAAFLNRIGSMKAKVTDWKELFWETAHNRNGD